MQKIPELIKNIEHLRDVVREFFVFGYKSRSEYDKKHLRTYDLEKSRIESLLNPFLESSSDKSGKRYRLSIDSAETPQNPFFRLFKVKSFTKNDIVLHFIILDAFQDLAEASLSEFADYISSHYNVCDIDANTIRNKLNEYVDLGILDVKEKGNKLIYVLSQGANWQNIDQEILHFFSEKDILGLVGSYLSDRKEEASRPVIYFKNHYFFSALDDLLLIQIFDYIQERRVVHVYNKAFAGDEERNILIFKLLINRQNGRRYIAAFDYDEQIYLTFRLDYIKELSPRDEFCDAALFDSLKAKLEERLSYTWNVNYHSLNGERTELIDVDMKIRISEGETEVFERLNREKRHGSVHDLGKGIYRFHIQVYDVSEMYPWLKTFIGRIISLDISNPEMQRRFFADFSKMLEACYEEGSSFP